MLGPCLDVYVVLACFGIVAVLGSMFGITLVLSLAYGSQGSLGGGGVCPSYYHVLYSHVLLHPFNIHVRHMEREICFVCLRGNQAANTCEQHVNNM